MSEGAFRTQAEMLRERIGGGPQLIPVLNKNDLPNVLVGSSVMSISAKTGAGIGELKDAFIEHVQALQEGDGGIVVTNARHVEALDHARRALVDAKAGIVGNIGGELLATRPAPCTTSPGRDHRPHHHRRPAGQHLFEVLHREMSTPLLSAFYFGSVEHYRLLAAHDKVIIDIGEHYVRQSYRTRTSIVGPNGRQDLVVHIGHDHGRKIPMREVALSYTETWPQQQLHAIRSAYGKASWTIHFIDAIEALLLAKHERLVDLDLASMRLCMQWLGLSTVVEVAERHVEVTDGLVDLRSCFHPKKPLPMEVPAVAPYPQVFDERHGFVGRASILDLLLNTGPAAAGRLIG